MMEMASSSPSLSALSTGDIPRRCPARARRRAAPTAATCEASTSNVVRENLTTKEISRRLLLSGSSSLVATGILTASHHPATAAADDRGGDEGGGKGASRPETVVYIGLTMDGFICRPNGDIDYLPVPNDSTEDYGFAAFLETVDAVVMGRKTYEQVVGFVMEGGVPWPYEGKTVTVAGGLSSLSLSLPANGPSTSVSSTLRQEDVPRELTGKVLVSSASPAETLRNMNSVNIRGENHPHIVKRVYVDGGRTIRSLLEDDDVDEMVLTTVPVLIGRGVPLFGFDATKGHEEQGGAAGDYDYAWRHISTQTFAADGLVKTTYRRER